MCALLMVGGKSSLVVLPKFKFYVARCQPGSLILHCLRCPGVLSLILFGWWQFVTVGVSLAATSSEGSQFKQIAVSAIESLVAVLFVFGYPSPRLAAFDAPPHPMVILTYDRFLR